MTTRLIIRNIPRSVRDSEVFDFFSKYCEIGDIVVHDDPVTEKRWAAIVLGEPELDNSENTEWDDCAESETNDHTKIGLDEHAIDELIAQLNRLSWRGKTLKARRG